MIVLHTCLSTENILGMIYCASYLFGEILILSVNIYVNMYIYIYPSHRK